MERKGLVIRWHCSSKPFFIQILPITSQENQNSVSKLNLKISLNVAQSSNIIGIKRRAKANKWKCAKTYSTATILKTNHIKTTTALVAYPLIKTVVMNLNSDSNCNTSKTTQGIPLSPITTTTSTSWNQIVSAHSKKWWVLIA